MWKLLDCVDSRNEQLAEVQSGSGILVVSSNGAESQVNTNKAPGFSEQNEGLLCLDKWSAGVLTIAAICSHTRSIS